MIKFLKISLLLILLDAYSLHAQLNKPLINYTPQTYKGQNQNWDITQTEQGVIYFANHDNLLRYNGQDWEIYKLDKPTIFRSVYTIENELFTGGLMEFGIWKKGVDGIFKFESLIQKLKIPILDGETIWNIKKIKDHIIFQSLERIYIINRDLKNYKIIKGVFGTNSLFEINGEILYLDLIKGFFKITDNQINQIPVLSKINYKNIIGIINLKESPYFISDQGNLFEISPEGIETRPSLQIPERDIYSVRQLKSGKIAIGTIQNGLKIYNPDLSLIDEYNKTNGLINNTILSIYEDNENNIWMGLDRGIAVLNNSSKFIEYFNLKNDIGSVYTSIYFNKNIYLGTNQGLFKIENIEKGTITRIKEINGQVWKLTTIDGKLYCSSNSGLDEINSNNQIIKLNEETGFWDIKKHPKYPTIFAAGTYEGIYLFELVNGKLKLFQVSKNFKKSSRYFEFEDESILVNNEYLGLSRLNYSNNFKNLKNIDELGIKGEKSSIFKNGNNILYKTNKGIYSIQKDKIILDSNFTKILQPENHLSSTIYSGQGNSFLAFTKNALKIYQKDIIQNKLKEKTLYLPEIIYSNLGNSGFENISNLYQDKYLIGLADGFIILELKEIGKNQFKNLILDKVSILREDKWESHLFKKDELVLESYDNSIKFSLINPNYQKYEPVLLRYELEGNNQFIQKETYNTDIEFINLSSGKYTLKLYLANDFKNLPIQIINFRINKPWYLNSFFIAIYVTIFIILFFGLFLFTRIYFKRREKIIAIRNQKKRENLQLIEQEKIDRLLRKNLQSELKNKKRELIITTENIIRKNTLLKQIGEELIQIEKVNNIDLGKLKSFINKNISENADWQRFEKAFNEFDQEFIKKIRDQYGNSLTQQDYLLITYIRSGLSSKEISNLLNISVKSVEMKRYRLRLKMGIDHESSLFEFINNF